MRRQLAALVGIVCILVTCDVWACGGCFSPVAPPAPQQPSPQYVVQDAERVVFVHDPTTKLTKVWVEVRFTGAAKDFGWVLPVPKPPKVSSGPTVALDRLDARLAPVYQLKYDGRENCRNPRIGCEPQPMDAASDGGSGGGSSGGGSDAGSGGSSGRGPGVDVHDSGQTGPYDFVVISSKSADALHVWLADRGYQIPAKAKSVVQSHLDKGDVFVAIKLANGKGVNLIRPIVLEMKDADPCVPLRLTSIAAADNMSVVVTLAGPGRAVPKNMLHVRLNEALIDWAKGGANYEQLLAAAVDEAGGRAFATQSSVPSPHAVEHFWSAKDLDVSDFEKVSNLHELAIALAETGTIWLNSDAAGVFSESTGFRQSIESVFGAGSATSALQQLWLCGTIWSGKTATPGDPAEAPCVAPGEAFDSSGPHLSPAQAKTDPVDGAKLAKALATEIAEPIHALRDAIAATERTTRIAMRISADEMDRDPIFGFHPTLPEIDAKRTATRSEVCSDGWLPPDGVRLTIPGIGSYRLPSGTSLGVLARFADAPSAAVIEVLDESGAPMAVAATQVGLVDTALAGAQLGVPSPAKALALSPAQGWVPPASDPFVQTAGPWPQPSNCTPRPGWVHGEPAPIGGQGTSWGGGGDGASASSAKASDAGGCNAHHGSVPGLPSPAWMLLVATAAIMLRRKLRTDD